MAALSLVFFAGLSTLWLGEPGIGFSTILIVLAGFVAATLAAELMSVFSNAIMTGLVPKDELGRLSGTGWAVGYFGGLASLALVAGFLVPMPGEAKTLLGFDPLLNLDAAAHQATASPGPSRRSGLRSSSFRFFCSCPTGARPRRSHIPSDLPTAELWDTIKSLPSMPSLLIFLIARMLYTDGLTAIFAFGGIYGASVFGWGPLELGIFGIVLTLVGAFGALIGGGLDDRLGPKTVIVCRAAGSHCRRDRHSLGRQDAHLLSRRTSRRRSRDQSRSRPSANRCSWDLRFSSASSPRRCRRQADRCWRAWRRLRRSRNTSGSSRSREKSRRFWRRSAVAFVTQETGSQRIGMSAVLAFLVVGVVMMLFVGTRPRIAERVG